MLFFLSLSCHIGRPTLNSSTPNLEWVENVVVSRQWEQQLEQAISKNSASENVEEVGETSRIEIITVQEVLVVDDPNVGQVWSVMMEIRIDGEQYIREEDRYRIETGALLEADQNRLECYQRLIDRISLQVILFYKYREMHED